MEGEPTLTQYMGEDNGRGGYSHSTWEMEDVVWQYNLGVKGVLNYV
jgi:hypothetical protein